MVIYWLLQVVDYPSGYSVKKNIVTAIKSWPASLTRQPKQIVCCAGAERKSPLSGFGIDQCWTVTCHQHFDCGV